MPLIARLSAVARRPSAGPTPVAGPGPAGPDRASLAAGVLDSTPALVCVVGADGSILVMNPALLRLTGYAEHEVVGRPFWDVLVIPEDLEAARAAHARAVTSATVGPEEADWLDRHGARHRIAMHSSVLLESDGRVGAVAYVGTDVTEQRRRQAELRQRADTDGLTGLRNRAAVLTALRGALEPGRGKAQQPVGVLFCDLDGFKCVNDLYGHRVGDALLVEVARRLLAVTDPEQVVARIGGDEFLVLAPCTTPAALTDLAAAIDAAVHRPFTTVNGTVTVGVSVGTALGRAGDHPDRLIEQADRHMYGVKTSHR